MVRYLPPTGTYRLTMILRGGCPQCGSTHHKKNGHIHNGKQNHRCKPCGRQFVSEFKQRRVSAEHRTLIERLLRERLSLRGICRVVGVGMKWLMAFLVERYEAAPAHLNVQTAQCYNPLLGYPLEIEADELWSFVGKKANPQWLWLALDARSRQVLAFHVGDRSRKSARQLWNQLPALYRQRATFYTDAYAPYGSVIPKAQHRTITKAARKTNHVERFNGTLRQRLSRLVRSALSFSKSLANHIGAIRYFLCHYNLSRAARCRSQSISP
jgi:insertion element IS1 protein InsB